MTVYFLSYCGRESTVCVLYACVQLKGPLGTWNGFSNISDVLLYDLISWHFTLLWISHDWHMVYFLHSTFKSWALYYRMCTILKNCKVFIYFYINNIILQIKSQVCCSKWNQLCSESHQVVKSHQDSEMNDLSYHLTVCVRLKCPTRHQ